MPSAVRTEAGSSVPAAAPRSVPRDQPIQGVSIFPHFGKTELFKIYRIENNAVAATQVVATRGQQHDALVDFLRRHDVTDLICGGLGEGARAANRAAGIAVHPGVCGRADEAVAAFLNGTLAAQQEATCAGHTCSGHCDHHC